MIKKLTTIPDLSIMKKDEKSFHYIDTFESQYVISSFEYDIISIGNLFLTSGPKWADNLMALRDKIVKIFGLKTTAVKNNDNLKFEPEGQLGIFKLYSRTENELIMGEDDKHLSFRVSLLLDSTHNDTNKNRIILTTMVEFKNLFGKLYFLPVKPFHKLIVKRTLKNMIRKIEIFKD
jgi:hypothetical protein